MIDKTKDLCEKIFDWDIMSKHIIFIKNEHAANLKVVVFFDSFLAHALPLYFDLFNEIYFIKNVYLPEIIKTLNPDYVFEFRLERFLF